MKARAGRAATRCLAIALSVVFLVPALASAHSRHQGHPDHLDHQRKALAAARADAARHHAEADRARQKAVQDAASAAALGQQQVAAAAALRVLEDQTAIAAATLASFDSQSQAARESLHRNEAALAALLPIMQRLSSQPAATMLAVPASPADAIRGILVLQGIATEIEDQAKAVHAQAQRVAILQAQTLSQQASLTAAVASQTRAENALNVQIAAAHTAETGDLDHAVQANAAALADAQNVLSLQTVIEKLRVRDQAAIAAARIPVAAANIAPATGSNAATATGANVAPATGSNAAPATGTNVVAATGAPVAGSIVQTYGAATLAGPAAGIVYKAPPGARVAAPCSGPVLYANRFQNYGQLVILDCGNHYVVVLSGMHHLDVTAGQQLARGQPVGQMQGYDTLHPATQPMLYVELRKHGTPVDPTAWLDKGGSG